MIKIEVQPIVSIALDDRHSIWYLLDAKGKVLASTDDHGEDGGPHEPAKRLLAEWKRSWSDPS